MEMEASAFEAGSAGKNVKVFPLASPNSHHHDVTTISASLASEPDFSIAPGLFTSSWQTKPCQKPHTPTSSHNVSSLSMDGTCGTSTFFTLPPLPT